MYNFDKTGAIFPANAEIFSFLLLGNENNFVGVLFSCELGIVDVGLNAEDGALGGLSAASTNVLAGNKRLRVRNTLKMQDFMVA
jgi:hypothetical protein